VSVPMMKIRRMRVGVGDFVVLVLVRVPSFSRDVRVLVVVVSVVVSMSVSMAEPRVYMRVFVPLAPEKKETERHQASRAEL
jgi:hypothetical protein